MACAHFCLNGIRCCWNWEENKPNGTSPQAHEKAWDKEIVVRGELDALRGDLEQYSKALAAIAGVLEQ